MDQPSLLDLFEEAKSSLDFRLRGNDETEPALNPFRKQFGVCGHCSEQSEQFTAHGSRLTVRLYWCHACGQTGCWEWLVKHKD
jgi:hypothetical protein